MSTIRNPNLKKLVVARALLVGGLGLAVLGLGTGIANASVSLWCPDTPAIPGGTGTVCINTLNTDHPCPTVMGFDALIAYVVTDAVSGKVLGQRDGLGPITVTWPASWSQPVQGLPPGVDPRLHMVYLGHQGSADFQGCMVEAAAVAQSDQD